MKRILIALLVTFSAARAGADLALDQLSPAARKLLPESRSVILQMKDGSTKEGTIEGQTDTDLTLRHKKGTITFTWTYKKADIAKATGSDMTAMLATEVLKYNVSTNAALPREQYVAAIALFDEFIQKCADSPAVPDVTTRRAIFTNELAHLDKGFGKIGGEWLPPVAAAIRKYDLLAGQLKRLEEKFPGTQSGSGSNPRAVEAYRRLLDEQKAVARGLPEVVTARIPELIGKKLLDEAADEVTAYQFFFLNQVLGDGSGGGTKEPVNMDFGQIVKLQQQIVDAHAAAHPAVALAEPGQPGMIRVPGGYFLMGDTKGALKDDNFPPRIVWLDDFLLDRCEVSNKEYREFLDYVKRTGDAKMEHPSAPPLKDHTPASLSKDDRGNWKFPDLSGDDQPVVGLDWFDAYAYAKWKGKRLPTEAEWERAVRGVDGRRYLWTGEAPENRSLNTVQGRQFLASQIDLQKPPPPPPPEKKGIIGRLTESPSPPPPVQRTTLGAVTWSVTAALPPEAATGRYDDRLATTNQFGFLHQIDNVSEWVGDIYSKTWYREFGLRNPGGPADDDVKESARVYRGGNYLTSDPTELMVCRRFFPKEPKNSSGMDSSSRPMIGLRCAMTPGR